MTFDFDLFLGFPVNNMHEQRLADIPSCRLSTFLNNEGTNLHETYYNDIRHIGKKLGRQCAIAHIDDISRNVISTFAALVGDDVAAPTLYLFALPVS